MKSIQKLPLVMYFSICFLFVFSTSASAYIDPSTTTFLLQAVAGIAIAVGAVVAVYWRKAKKKVMNKLGVEENAKKTVEEDVVVTDDTHIDE